MQTIRLLPAALAAACIVAVPLARAQQNPGYFIPPSAQPTAPGRPAAPPRPAAPRPPAPREPAANVQVPVPAPPQQQLGQAPEAPRELPPLPPIPDLPPLPRGSAPPAAVIGVLGVPDVMRASTAAQQIERVIGERREKLSTDATKEQATWRDLAQQLASQRASLTADQVRTRERELQERITNSQRQFRERNRILQEAAQYSLAQVERILISVIRQVSESRGINLVLHRNQVALNVNEFDLTEQVVDQVNKVLPQVNIPPDGVSPATFAQQQAAQPPAPTPASAAPTPGPTAPARR